MHLAWPISSPHSISFLTPYSSPNLLHFPQDQIGFANFKRQTLTVTNPRDAGSTMMVVDPAKVIPPNARVPPDTLRMSKHILDGGDARYG